MADRYEHRNGETEPPTESGWYWFSGESHDVTHAGLIQAKYLIQKVREVSDLW